MNDNAPTDRDMQTALTHADLLDRHGLATDVETAASGLPHHPAVADALRHAQRHGLIGGHPIKLTDRGRAALYRLNNPSVEIR